MYSGGLIMNDLNTYIDHTNLKPNATRSDIERLCSEAKQYHFKSVCVNSANVPQAAELLSGTDVAVCCVVGFPLGACLTSVKAFETSVAVRAGATEIDMVINIGRAKEGDWAYVIDDISAVVQAASGKALVKVIIETCLLTDDEKIRACEAAVKAGADFVKTSTGFSTGGATVSDVRLMRSTVGDALGVKAAGGIRTREDAEQLILAGADRLGASCGVKLVNE